MSAVGSKSTEQNKEAGTFVVQLLTVSVTDLLCPAVRLLVLS